MLQTSIKISPRTLLILGIVFVVLGFLAIILPVVASFVVTSFVGWLLVIGGVLYGYHAFGIRDGWNIAATLLLALLTLASGIILLIFPIAGVITLTMFLAAYFVAAGILKAILRSPASRDLRLGMGARQRADQHRARRTHLERFSRAPLSGPWA